MTHLIAPIDPGVLRDLELTLSLESFAYNPVHQVPTYQFKMMHSVSAEELGGIRLRVGSTRHIDMYAGHIGYNVVRVHRGHRYAMRSLVLLLPLARQLGLDPLWITCDPENRASRRTLELAGAQLIEIVEVPFDCIIRQSGHPRKCRYRL